MGNRQAEQVSDQAFRQLLTQPRPVAVCFVSEWSAPCREMRPVYDRLAETFSGTVNTVCVDPEEAPLLAAEHKLVSIPSMLLFVGGEEVERMVGIRSQEALEKMIVRHL